MLRHFHFIEYDNARSLKLSLPYASDRCRCMGYCPLLGKKWPFFVNDLRLASFFLHIRTRNESTLSLLSPFIIINWGEKFHWFMELKGLAKILRVLGVEWLHPMVKVSRSCIYSKQENEYDSSKWLIHPLVILLCMKSSMLFFLFPIRKLSLVYSIRR